MRDFLKDKPFLHRDYARENTTKVHIQMLRKPLNLERSWQEHHYIKNGEIPAFKKVGGKITKAERKVIYADENPSRFGIYWYTS